MTTKHAPVELEIAGLPVCPRCHLVWPCEHGAILKVAPAFPKATVSQLRAIVRDAA